MKLYTWRDLCHLTNCSLEDLTGESDSSLLDDIASGTILGNEIISELQLP